MTKKNSCSGFAELIFIPVGSLTKLNTKYVIFRNTSVYLKSEKKWSFIRNIIVVITMLLLVQPKSNHTSPKLNLIKMTKHYKTKTSVRALPDALSWTKGLPLLHSNKTLTKF
jgi:hypothetical protein